MKPNLVSYDHIILAYSGGKDSTASLLSLIEDGAPPERIELWHHEIDGRGGPRFMDWPVTADYCRRFAAALGFPLYYSWKVGGFQRELLRENARTSPTQFETPDGIQTHGGTSGKYTTRRKFPQVSANLSVRWCSPYLKIDVAACALRNQPRFNNSRTLFVTGERAEESAARAKYKTFEVHRTDRRDSPQLRRHVDHYRPIHAWPVGDVWKAIEQHHITAHPAYYLGWGRLSCACCIFGSNDQWASLAQILPSRVEQIARLEQVFNTTIRRSQSVTESVQAGTPYPSLSKTLVDLALSDRYHGEILTSDWTLPAGAFGENAGPS